MLTGRGVRVAIIDSGVHAAHPHVNGVAGGVAIDDQGREHGDFVDRLGHGTAVAAAIREKAPDAELYAIKVFDRELATNIDTLIDALDWAGRSGMHLVNMSLGTTKSAHEAALGDAVGRAARQGALVVSARDDGGDRWLPGSLAGVIGVRIDWTLPRDRYRAIEIDGTIVFHASGFAREIPGVPPERNLHGISLAVANMTGFAARAVEECSQRSFEAIVTALVAHSAT